MAVALEFYCQSLKTRLAINEQVAVTGNSGISHGSDDTLYQPIDGEPVSCHGINGIFRLFGSYHSLHEYSREEVAYESYVKFVAFLVNLKLTEP